ncbi:SGNH/GDSL hydrolase family protein, partial [Acinetobacter baumannii]
LARAIAGGGPIKIVAMGSSSTAGRADVLPYPYWLEMYLRNDPATHGNARIDVINRGRGGEEADKEFDRFQEDIFELEPTLVIWQVGT